MKGAEFMHDVYRFEPIDFERGLPAILICAGSGMMLGLMDRCPLFRWCLDFDTMTTEERERFVSWCVCLEHVTPLVALAGWFSATSPALLAEAARALRRSTPIYVQYRGNGPDPFVGLRTANDLGEFEEQCNARLIEAASSPHWQNLSQKKAPPAEAEGVSSEREQALPSLEGHERQRSRISDLPAERPDEPRRRIMRHDIVELHGADDAAE